MDPDDFQPPATPRDAIAAWAVLVGVAAFLTVFSYLCGHGGPPP